MARISEKSMVNQVAEIAMSNGFKAKIEPERSLFQLFGWFSDRRFNPNMTVRNGDRVVAVVVMLHTVLLYDVYLTSQTAGKNDIGTILCIPDDSFRHVPGSVHEYAGQMDVRLCPLSQVGDALKELLD